MEHGSVVLWAPGVSLSYGGLVVSDARGRVLRSWLGLARGGVLIRVDDRGAVWRRDEELPGVRRLYVDDPFGNRIELIDAAER